MHGKMVLAKKILGKECCKNFATKKSFVWQTHVVKKKVMFKVEAMEIKR